METTRVHRAEEDEGSSSTPGKDDNGEDQVKLQRNKLNTKSWSKARNKS